MEDTTLPVEGGCRCGQVRLRISAPPILTAACHCTGCQRMSASAFSLSAAIPTEGFQVTSGEPVLGGKDPAAGHHFCPRCMTWMYTHSQEMPWFVNLRPTMLDAPRWHAPFIETFTSEKLPWATTPAVRSFETFPGFDEFEPLMGAYAEWAGKEGGG